MYFYYKNETIRPKIFEKYVKIVFHRFTTIHEQITRQK